MGVGVGVVVMAGVVECSGAMGVDGVESGWRMARPALGVVRVAAAAPDEAWLG